MALQKNKSGVSFVKSYFLTCIYLVMYILTLIRETYFYFSNVIIKG